MIIKKKKNGNYVPFRNSHVSMNKKKKEERNPVESAFGWQAQVQRAQSWYPSLRGQNIKDCTREHRRLRVTIDDLYTHKEQIINIWSKTCFVHLISFFFFPPPHPRASVFGVSTQNGSGFLFWKKKKNSIALRFIFSLILNRFQNCGLLQSYQKIAFELESFE